MKGQSRKLNLAQKKALCGIPVNREFTPEHTGFQWPTLEVLKRRGMINSVKSGIEGMGPKAKHVITKRGLDTRARILANPNE